MEWEKNIILMIDYYLKVNIKMVKKMEKEKNIFMIEMKKKIIILNIHLKENI